MVDRIGTPSLVSVIMPTYNHAAYIGLAIESVLAQTHSALELIVIDNCSSDDTPNIVARLASNDKRIRYEKVQNGGVIANSRNRGIDISSGEFIAFLDSDDLWTPDKLKIAIQTMGRLNVDCVCSNSFVIDSSGRIVGFDLPRKIGSSTFHPADPLLLLNNYLGCSTVVLRRSLLRDRRFNEEPRNITAEDYLLWLTINHDASIYYIGTPLVYYRVHDKNSSTTILRKSGLKDRIQFMHAVLDQIQLTDWYDGKTVDLARRTHDFFSFVARRKWGLALRKSVEVLISAEASGRKLFVQIIGTMLRKRILNYAYRMGLA